MERMMDQKRAVLVTGASSGIGRKITEHLAGAGYFVYAGVRKNSNLRALGALANVRPLRLDVVNPEDIRAAADLINAEGRLYGLVNNAGVGTVGPVVGGNDREFDLVMAVNVHGPYRVTQSFAPAIIANQGRIVMIGSISGILADSHAGPYSMSKHALEALTDCLALELGPLGVHVSIVEPGVFKTNILRSAIDRAGVDPRTPDLSECQEPDAVAAAVAAALFEPRPKRRYLVVSNHDEARRTIGKQISQLVEINEGHAYSYDRDTLFKMIDEALIAIRRGSGVSDERLSSVATSAIAGKFLDIGS